MIALDEPRQRELAGLRPQMALSSFFDQLTVLDPRITRRAGSQARGIR
jgi:hypothetical protein